MVMVVRAWVEEGRKPGFRARLIQAETPGVVPGGPAHVVTTSIDQTVEAIRRKLSGTPRIGVVLGSGLGAFGDSLEALVKVPYAELPHMPVSRVVDRWMGHRVGKTVLGVWRRPGVEGAARLAA